MDLSMEEFKVRVLKAQIGQRASEAAERETNLVVQIQVLSEENDRLKEQLEKLTMDSNLSDQKEDGSNAKPADTSSY